MDTKDEPAWGLDGCVELEITADAESAMAVTLSPEAAGECVPFIAPRSSNASRTAARRARPLFYRDARAAAAVEGSSYDTNAAVPPARPARAGNSVASVERGADADTPGAALSTLYQAEDDKTYLHRALEELLTCPIPSSSCAPTLGICAYLLDRYFHISTAVFRPHQQEVCLSVLQGVRTLAVCPTGWGKSLCYQFPMLVHRLLFLARWQAWQAHCEAASGPAGCGGTGEASGADARPSTAPPARPADLYSKFCIVVSPLLSLIADQMDKIRGAGCLKAITISSSVSAAREAELLRGLASPTSDVDILFTSPEKYVGSTHVRELLRSHAHRVAIVCVDEVHCVSRWAYDFRPSFMYVSRVLSDVAPVAAAHVPFLCLTATATRAVVRDIELEYGIGRTVVATDQYRHNLVLGSIDLVARQQQQQQQQQGGSTGTVPRPPTQRVLQDSLLEAVAQLPKPMIVYVHSRADADELSSYIAAKLGGGSGRNTAAAPGKKRDVGGSATGGVFSSASATASLRNSTRDRDDPGRELVVRCYHAALSRQLRTATQQQFIDNRIDVLVATVAFGMGIDKPNIRSVVHAYAPSSLESYVQEIGRAGRDGQRSFCRLLYNPFEFYGLRARALASVVSPAEVRNVVRCIFRNPTTRVGDALVLVCPYKIAEELAVAEETVETILFMIVTGRHAPLAGAHGEGGAARAPIIRAVRGCCPLGFSVLSVRTERSDGDEMDGDARASWRRQQQQQHGSKKRPRVGSAAGSYMDNMFATASGVSSLLAQLNAHDAVLDVFRGRSVVENQVAAANEANMSWDDFQFRLEDLQTAGTLRLSRLSSSQAFLLEVGAGFADAACPARQEELSALLFEAYNERLASQTDALRTMFDVLSHPTHEGIQAALGSCDGARSTSSWSPPPRSLTKVEAVSIANDFVAKNAIRLQSTYEAARCLLGIMPKSLIKHGKYAGQIPLELSWYVSSPYFGTLKEYDLEWVLAVLRPHNLDCPRE